MAGFKGFNGFKGISNNGMNSSLDNLNNNSLNQNGIKFGNINNESLYDEETINGSNLGNNENNINNQNNEEESSTKKNLKAVGRATAAYATGGASVGADKQIADNEVVDKTLDDISDKIEDNKVLKAMNDELAESGVPDTVNDALDTVASAKNKDIKGTVESAKKTKDDIKKIGKEYVKKHPLQVALMCAPIIFVVLILFVVIMGPELGGELDLTENAETSIEDGVNTNLTNDETRNNIISTAASLIGRPYNWGGKASSPGLEGVPATGLDCSGFVQWVYWTATGNKVQGSTAALNSAIGTTWTLVSEQDLLPGDVGLKINTAGGTNHTGIYAGDGQWIHAESTKTGIVKNSTSFNKFLRLNNLS